MVFAGTATPLPAVNLETESMTVWQLVIIHQHGPAIGTYPLDVGDDTEIVTRRYDKAIQDPAAIAVFLFKAGQIVCSYMSRSYRVK